MAINTALTLLFKIIFIALFHVLGHADHKNDFYLFFYYYLFLFFYKYASESRGGAR